MSVNFEIVDQVARVTINRPERMNAIDVVTADRLDEIWEDIESNPDIRVVILTGAGDKAFCAGADMKSGVEKSGLDYWADARPGGFGGITLRESLDVPVIARVNGMALGGGFEMVMGCDIIVAAETAKFGLPEARVGRLPLDGGMVLLPRLIPEKLASGLLLTGRNLTAVEALKYGLINEVVTSDQLDGAVDVWVTDIMRCAPLSVKALKQSMKQTAHMTPQDAQAARLPAVIRALNSEDAEEGVRAFREKREPRWSGK